VVAGLPGRPALPLLDLPRVRGLSCLSVSLLGLEYVRDRAVLGDNDVSWPIAGVANILSSSSSEPASLIALSPNPVTALFLTVCVEGPSSTSDQCPPPPGPPGTNFLRLAGGSESPSFTTLVLGLPGGRPARLGVEDSGAIFQHGY